MVSYRRERERTDQGAKSSEAQGLEGSGPNVPYPERVGVTPRGGEVVSGAPVATSPREMSLPVHARGAAATLRCVLRVVPVQRAFCWCRENAHDWDLKRHLFDRSQSPTLPFFSVLMPSACYDHSSIARGSSDPLFGSDQVYLGDSQRIKRSASKYRSTLYLLQGPVGIGSHGRLVQG